MANGRRGVGGSAALAAPPRGRKVSTCGFLCPSPAPSSGEQSFSPAHGDAGWEGKGTRGAGPGFESTQREDSGGFSRSRALCQPEEAPGWWPWHLPEAGSPQGLCLPQACPGRRTQ